MKKGRSQKANFRWQQTGGDKFAIFDGLNYCSQTRLTALQAWEPF